MTQAACADLFRFLLCPFSLDFLEFSHQFRSFILFIVTVLLAAVVIRAVRVGINVSRLF